MSEDLRGWRERSVAYARIMSRVRWTPVADGMPIKGGGSFEKGTEYTGVPYSSVKSVGRYIGFDIFLKTFLAAAENPRSVLYTENLSATVSNAACYYGKVCSSFASYALQCGIWYVSRVFGPRFRSGVEQVVPASAQTVEAGDVIHTPPDPGSHVEVVTDVVRDGGGKATHVLVEESRPPVARAIERSAADFDAHLAVRNKEVYRITDPDAWRGENRAESFLFPNYAEDAAVPTVNRTVLLDLGDWVPYFKGRPVKFNVMDRDGRGVREFVIGRGGRTVERIPVREPGVVERTFSVCGDYTAHCVMGDGSPSQACEFAVCDLALNVPMEKIPPDEPWPVEFSAENMDAAMVYLWGGKNEYCRRMVRITGQDRRNGRVVIPAGLIGPEDAALDVWLLGENRHGRLKAINHVAVHQ